VRYCYFNRTEGQVLPAHTYLLIVQASASQGMAVLSHCSIVFVFGASVLFVYFCAAFDLLYSRVTRKSGRL
jgi:hypothetical protein